jgi:hypothetical protein
MARPTMTVDRADFEALLRAAHVPHQIIEDVMAGKPGALDDAKDAVVIALEEMEQYGRDSAEEEAELAAEEGDGAADDDE